MWVAHSIVELRRQRLALGGRVALVPTMGALHAGHLSLVERAKGVADHVLVSIFVNPAQFGPTEDFARYPRPIEHDLDLCRSAGVAGVFNPPVEEMYPAELVGTDVNVAAMADILEGAVRPVHFGGVCRVVLKLFHLFEPQAAAFGRKDFQQLRIIQAMTADLNLPIAIVEVPTLREADGLAMSSRNIYLQPEARRHAVGIFKALNQAKMMVETGGAGDPAEVEAAMKETLAAHHFEVDYATIRHPLTLAALDSVNPALTHGVVALIAARIGGVRLIDNMMLGERG